MENELDTRNDELRNCACDDVDNVFSCLIDERDQDCFRGRNESAAIFGACQEYRRLPNYCGLRWEDAVVL